VYSCPLLGIDHFTSTIIATILITKNMTTPEQHLLTRVIDTILPTPKALADALTTAKRDGVVMRGYLGVDPTSTHLHIGHSVGLRNLARFQQAGHQAILLIGDFTGRLGDPDKLATRVPLSKEQIALNMATYLDQVRYILDFEGDPGRAILPVELRHNSEWSDPMTFEEVVKLAANFTVQQMLERDMFQKRLKEQRPISLSEFFYPLMQGYDAVALKADVQFGGTDQTFNMLAGRTLNKALENREMFVVAHPLLADAKGVKIGKTMGNAINIDNPPNELYGQIMSLTDDVIVNGFRLLTELPMEDLTVIEDAIAKGQNPMRFKKQLAYMIVQQFSNQATADAAQEYFQQTVQNQEIPTDIDTTRLKHGQYRASSLVANTMIAKSLSNSELRRLWDQSGIELSFLQQSIKARDQVVDTRKEDLTELTVRIGKRQFEKLVFED
jgi:tyrosyl-tRNA synthetase